eukprot:Polyplicarium_translucidae@DN2535_c0_g1_i1.p1
MSGIARRRLLRDFQKLKTESPHGVIGCPIESDIMRWSAVIFGPEESPWEGGTFQLELSFSDDYPNKPPTVRFVTRVFHPNVYMDGSICLDILQHRWSPIYDISAILTSIQSLLTDPNPNSPANSDSLKTIKALEVSPRSGTDDDSSAAPPANEDSGTAPEAQSPATVARAEDTEG